MECAHKWGIEEDENQRKPQYTFGSVFFRFGKNVLNQNTNCQCRKSNAGIDYRVIFIDDYNYTILFNMRLPPVHCINPHRFYDYRKLKMKKTVFITANIVSEVQFAWIAFLLTEIQASVHNAHDYGTFNVSAQNRCPAKRYNTPQMEST